MKNPKFLLLWLIFVDVVLAGLLIFLFWVNSSNASRANAEEDQVEQLSLQIDRKQAQLNEQARQQGLNSSNASIRMNVKQLDAQKKAKKVANKLFPILFTFSSSNEYNSRADQAQDLVTDAVLKNEDIFGSDYQDGSHYVDGSGLHDKFTSINFNSGLLTSDGKLPIMVRVNYLTWFEGQNKSSMGDIYLGEYDYTNNKISSLRMAENVYQANQAENAGF